MGGSYGSEPPNNSFKPNLLRYGKSVAEKACHAFASTTQVGLTQQLSCDVIFQAAITSPPCALSSSRRRALTMVNSLRMQATNATLPSFPRALSCW